MKLNIIEEKYVVTWKYSKWLFLSSFFFIIPSIYALNNKLYIYSILLLNTSLISANYWKRATYSWRRNLDLIFSKIGFCILLINYVIYVKYIIYIITGYLGIIILLYCYYLSNKLFELKNNNWYKYHIIFHFIIMYEQLIILDSILTFSKIN